MKRIFSILLVGLLVSNVGCALLNLKLKPNVQTQRIAKAGWLDGFELGHAELLDQHQSIIALQIVPKMEQRPKATLVIKGSVDDHRILGNSCYVADYYPRFCLGHCAKTMTRVKGEDQCQTCLGLARANNVAEIVIKRGIGAPRIQVFTEVDRNRRPGDQSQNRAVSWWLIDLPEGAELISATEEADGTLLATYQLASPKKIWDGKPWWEAQVNKVKAIFTPKPKVPVQQPKNGSSYEVD